MSLCARSAEDIGSIGVLFYFLFSIINGFVTPVKLSMTLITKGLVPLTHTVCRWRNNCKGDCTRHIKWGVCSTWAKLVHCSETNVILWNSKRKTNWRHARLGCGNVLNKILVKYTTLWFTIFTSEIFEWPAKPKVLQQKLYIEISVPSTYPANLYDHKRGKLLQVLCHN